MQKELEKSYRKLTFGWSDWKKLGEFDSGWSMMSTEHKYSYIMCEC